MENNVPKELTDALELSNAGFAPEVVARLEYESHINNVLHEQNDSILKLQIDVNKLKRLTFGKVEMFLMCLASGGLGSIATYYFH